MFPHSSSRIPRTFFSLFTKGANTTACKIPAEMRHNLPWRFPIKTGKFDLVPKMMVATHI